MKVGHIGVVPKIPHSSVFKLMWLCRYLIPRKQHFKDRIQMFLQTKANKILTRSYYKSSFKGLWLTSHFFTQSVSVEQYDLVIGVGPLLVYIFLLFGNLNLFTNAGRAINTLLQSIGKFQNFGVNKQNLPFNLQKFKFFSNCSTLQK